MVQTVPPMANVEVSVDGVPSRTDATGLAVINVNEPGNHELSIRSNSTDQDARVSFALWSDGSTARDRVVDVSSFTFLQAGFAVSRRIDFRVLDDAGRPIDPQVDSITIVDNTGLERPVEGDSASWVPGNRLVSESDGLTSQPLTWRIANVVVEGQSIDRIGASEFLSGEGLWSVRLDPDAAASGGVGDKDESGGAAWSTNYLYLIIAALLLGGIAVMIKARRGSESPRNRRVARRSPLRGIRRAARPEKRDYAAPFKWVTKPLRGVRRAARHRKKRDYAAPFKSAAWRMRGRLHRRPTRSPSEHLRVRLKSGHTIEGWTDPQARTDREALRLVSVTRVLDNADQPIPFQPRDAFLLRSRIASLEILMTSEEGPRVLLQPEEEDLQEAEVIDLREGKGTHAR